MAFQTALLPGDAYNNLRMSAVAWKQQAQNALATTQAGTIDANFVFRVLDQLNAIVASINTWKAVAGLDAFATSEGYTGTMSTDAAAVAAAALSCVNWVTSNFPKDTQGFAQAYTLNADGSRTAATFTNTQTSGLQTALQTFISTIQ